MSPGPLANTKTQLQFNREAPIYHKPCTITCSSVEELKNLYPNSFDRLGSLSGEYNIKINPVVPPVQHVRRKVLIESKEAFDKELDYLIEEEIITKQIQPTPCVCVSSAMYPRKLNGNVMVYLDPGNLNNAIIRENHKLLTVENVAHEIAESNT